MISEAHLAFLSLRYTLVALIEIKTVYYDLFKE